MPTYRYVAITECKHGEFEEYHSMSVKLTHCPHCKEEGVDTEVKRLINMEARGVVELYGDDLVASVKSGAQQLKKDAARDEKIYSNLISETKYQDIQTRMDKRNR
jgi:CII-binding regulator of phage lambda lysogenization HflD